jgi:hypothetical protein
MDKFAYNLGVKAAQDNFPVFDPKTNTFGKGKAPEVEPQLLRYEPEKYISPYRPKTRLGSGGLAGGMRQKYYDWMDSGQSGPNPRTAKTPRTPDVPKSLRAYHNVPTWREVSDKPISEIANPWKESRTFDPSGTLTNTPANEQSLMNTMLGLQRRWMDWKLGKGEFSKEEQAQMDKIREQIMPTRQKERQKYWDKKLIKDTGGRPSGSHWYSKVPGQAGVYSPIK